MHSLGATSTPEPPEQNTDRMRAISACRASRYDCSCKRMKRLRDWESRIRRGTALFGVATRFSMAMSVPAMEDASSTSKKLKVLQPGQAQKAS